MSKGRLGDRYPHPRSYRRREWFQGAAALGVLGFAGALGLARCVSEPSSKGQKDEDVIGTEARHQGLLLSRKEQDLWRSAHQYTGRKLSFNSETAAQADQLIQQTLFRMSQSENPYFRSGANIITGLVNNHLLNASLNASQAIAGKEPFAAVNSAVLEERYVLKLDVHGPQILNESSGLLLATALVHEAKHLDDRLTFQKTLPDGLPAIERVQHESVDFSAKKVIYEAEAYALQAEAFLYAIRQGVEGAVPNDLLVITAEFIRQGRNPKNPGWVNFIARRIAA